MRIPATVLLLLIPLSVYCQKIITGRVVAISDGDTFTILSPAKEQIKLRLYGIDCPEKKQDFGTRAKQYTSDLCYGKTVKVQIKNNDRYGRKIAIVNLPDGRNLNHELLLAGLAWHYTYYDHSPDFAEAEQRARKNKMGLWSSSNSIAPWDFRKDSKTSKRRSRARTGAMSHICVAITQSGKRCRHSATIGDRCWQHQL